MKLENNILNTTPAPLKRIARPSWQLQSAAVLSCLHMFGTFSNAYAQEEPAALSEIPAIQVYSTIPNIPSSQSGVNNNQNTMNGKVFLRIVINGAHKNLVAELYERNGNLFIQPKELEAIGLVADKSAIGQDGLIDLSRLPNVSYEYGQEQQEVLFRTSNTSALMPTQIKLWRVARNEDAEEELKKAESMLGALLNYTVYADSGSDRIGKIWDFKGVSAQLDARVFSKFGTLSSNQIVRFAEGEYKDTVRLDTTWSYQDEEKLITYTVGDLTTRGLSWTRPVRMGGGQIRRNFALRSDLVTLPLPSISGSAAVPSAVDVFLNNTRRTSSDVPAGSFDVTDFPVVTGANVARMVVRDALGRETVTEVPFYASIDMLRKGLVDFSMEGGFVRYSYGSDSNEYDKDFATSATVRYGLSNNMTLEGHAEYTKNLYNGGLGTVFNVGNFGAVSLAGAASSYKGHTGQQISAGIQAEKFGMRLNARTQRTFGEYADIASATARNVKTKYTKNDFTDDNYFSGSTRPTKSMDQISLSVPLKFDPTSLNLSFTQAEYHHAQKSKIISLSANRNFGKRVFGYITGYADLKDSKNYGVFAGLSVSFDNGIQLSAGANNDRDGTYIQTELSKSEKREIGSYGWRLRDIEGSRTNRGASGSYRGKYARVQGSVEQNEEKYRATAQVEGAVVVAGGGIFAANHIDDSFAIVDVGAPNVDVLRNNQPYGKTGKSGKLLIPDLWSYQETRLSIDPQNLPLDSMTATTQMQVKAGYRTGLLARFDVQEASDSALVSLKDDRGAPLALGSVIMDKNNEELAYIGYDGQTLLPLTGIKLPASFTVKLPAQKLCRVTIPTNINKGVSEGVTDLRCSSTSDF